MIKGILLDLSGVIYTGDQIIPGAADAILKLRTRGLPVRFVTNTSRSPKRKLLRKLEGFGISIEAEELFTPAQAACDWLHKHQRSAHLLIHPDLGPDFDGLSEYPEKALVVGDAGRHFTYDTLNEAFRVMINEDAEFLALANNRVFKDSDGKLSLDAGPFVSALEYASRKKPIILGKPSAAFFEAALASMSCEPGYAVMVGDDAEMDVAGAIAAGIGHGLLVRTGKYLPGVEHTVEPGPHATLDDIGQAADWILAHTG
jgi:HAD superfamily hydrolase (TIGR01458 family)